MVYHESNAKGRLYQPLRFVIILFTVNYFEVPVEIRKCISLFMETVDYTYYSEVHCSQLVVVIDDRFEKFKISNRQIGERPWCLPVPVSCNPAVLKIKRMCTWYNGVLLSVAVNPWETLWSLNPSLYGKCGQCSLRKKMDIFAWLRDFGWIPHALLSLRGLTLEPEMSHCVI